MGAGKTTLLESLKQRKFKTLDLDEHILSEHTNNSSLSELIEEVGFSSFRSLELKAIKKLQERQGVIIALGGGTLNEKSIELLKPWSGFWLNTDFEVCYERVKGDLNRPLVQELSKEGLRELFNKRKALYSRFELFEKGSFEQSLKNFPRNCN